MIPASGSWTATYRELVREAWRRFQITEEWPSIIEMQRWADQRGIPLDVQVAAETRPGLPGVVRILQPRDFTLGLAQLAELPEAAAACTAAAALCRLAHARYMGDDEQPTVTHADMPALAPDLSSEAATRAARVLYDEPLSPFGSASLGPTWRFTVSLERIRRFEAVETIDDLLQRQREYAEALQRQVR